MSELNNPPPVQPYYETTGNPTPAPRTDRKRTYRIRHAERIKKLSFVWRNTNPKKRRAHYRVQAAIRSGEIVRPELCQECGATCKPQAHHEDYSKPLDVEWLCAACHSARHGVCIGAPRKFYAGEDHPTAKLSNEDVKRIKTALMEKTDSKRQIARTFGVNEALIRQIEKGKIWKHINN